MQEKYTLILKNSSILLVEDEKKLRESFARVLSLFVKRVYEAKDADEALKTFNENRIDIIFSDVKMPAIDGISLIKMIRDIDSNMPIVITSAYSDKNYLLESIKLSLVEYLIKPIKEDDLMRVLSNCAKKIDENTYTSIIVNKNFIYDFTNKTCTLNEKSIPLTAKEIDFIELLLLNRGNLVSKAKIESKLYMYGETPPSALKNLVFKLRKKIGNDIIKTKGQLGYIIENQ